MIYVLTVHWNDPKWINLQQKFLRANIRSPYSVCANLEGIVGYSDQFDFVTHKPGDHPSKLNALAEAVIARGADSEDLLLFLDGDAFPVRPLDEWMAALLDGYPLAAVRRIENAGDVQPHPSFCVTTVRFWRESRGDWRGGETWVNSRGEIVTDVGGALLGKLREHGVRWREILRSNSVDLHPLLFGLYDRHLYHHGAGFRPPVLRVEGSEKASAYLELKGASFRQLGNVRPKHVMVALKAMRQRGAYRKVMENARLLQAQADEMFEEIARDPEFYRRLEASED
jgi:hypothetical protein